MKALLDEHLTPKLAELMRSHGQDVVAIGERAELIGADDRTVFEIATSEGRAVVTNNVKDFRPLAADFHLRGRIHGGLILLPSTRSRNSDAIAALAAAIGGIMGDHPDGIFGAEFWVGPLSGA